MCYGPVFPDSNKWPMTVVALSPTPYLDDRDHRTQLVVQTIQFRSSNFLLAILLQQLPLYANVTMSVAARRPQAENRAAGHRDTAPSEHS